MINSSILHPNLKIKGIRQWQIKLCTSPMMSHKFIPCVDYYNWLKRLDTQLNQPTYQSPQDCEANE